ncbi:G protein-regulated inducer of neurite outgrowth 1 [Pyxicephalus adspersus]|uniref:G protein-regulated inducer of neurite outgrowth 1 n=1 Tax=Pyxicephalus adspersus TaxID=30357 RepID=UPI003B5B6DD2
MGSPKEPQRLQLTRPDGASENVPLRSPISSRIWQAEDPTHSSGFDGEDLCMRNFCVSVHGDHEFPEGFSFDIDADRVLEVHKDFSVDAECTYSFYESREDQTSSRQADLNKSDNSVSETYIQGKSITDGKDVCFSENTNDLKGQVVNAPIVTEVSLSLETNTDVVSGDCGTEGYTNISLKNNKKETVEDLEKVKNVTTKEQNKETQAEGLVGCREFSNGELSKKTQISDPVLLNKQDDTQERQYRSIAVSPIVPPDGQSSFSFQTMAPRPSGKNTYEVRTDDKETGKKDDLPKTHSFELVPPNHDGGTEARYRSVAVSPIIPPGETSSFTFQTDHSAHPQGDPMVSATTQRTDTEKADNSQKVCTQENVNHSTGGVEYKSVAVSPIIIQEGSSFTFYPLRTDGSTVGGQLTPKTCRVELIPPSQDVGTQARAECVSVAVSPIIPPSDSSSFVFQSEQQSGHKISDKQASCAKCAHNEDASTQAGTGVQCVSVAVSPIVLPGGSSSFTFLSEKTVLSPATELSKDEKMKAVDNLPKTYSFELTPPDDCIRATPRVEYRSIAVSPIIPPNEVSFTFQNKGEILTIKGTEGKEDSGCVNVLPKTCSFEITPPDEDISTEAEHKVKCVSVAISPFVFSQESSSFTFQEEQMAKQHEQTKKQDSCNISQLSNTLSETKPQYQDVGTQVDITVQCSSIAISPMIPLDGSSSFVFHTDGINQASSLQTQLLEKPAMKDAELQVSFPVETRSIATDPMTPRGKSPRVSYPDIHVKEVKSSHPEPVREVSWDEKGMTWEVYGASMEVEVLGMAIQKHLEKQIEEHGKREKVMTPQNTRGSSVRGAAVKSESKRQPGAFRSFFHRRPRCCSSAAPAVE